MRGCFNGFIFLCAVYSILCAQPPVTTPTKDSTKDELNTIEAPQEDIKNEEAVNDAKDSSASDDVNDTVGALTIITVPDSAFVILDDQLKGRAPITISDIPAGKHTIILKKKDHFAKKATVNISAGIENKVTFELVKPVRLVVSSEPSGALVQLNNDNVGKTPYADTKLKPSTYAIGLALEGYERQQRTVTLGSGEKDSIHVILAPLSKALKDTVSTPEQKTKKEKSKLSSVLDKVAIGVFVCFSLIILLIELTQNK